MPRAERRQPPCAGSAVRLHRARAQSTVHRLSRASTPCADSAVRLHRARSEHRAQAQSTVCRLSLASTPCLRATGSLQGGYRLPNVSSAQSLPRVTVQRPLKMGRWLTAPRLGAGWTLALALCKLHSSPPALHPEKLVSEPVPSPTPCPTPFVLFKHRSSPCTTSCQ